MVRDVTRILFNLVFSEQKHRQAYNSDQIIRMAYHVIALNAFNQLKT